MLICIDDDQHSLKAMVLIAKRIVGRSQTVQRFSKPTDAMLFMLGMKEPPKAILSDYMMPVADGEDVFHFVRGKLGWDCPFFLLTASNPTPLLERNHDWNVIYKPMCDDAYKQIREATK